MKRPPLLAGISLLFAACAPYRAPVSFDLRPVTNPAISPGGRDADKTSYAAVSTAAGAILGCDVSPASPVCTVAPPTAEEDSAFREEGARLTFHADARCRKLGEAIIANESRVMMYPKAPVRQSRGEVLYGVGHAYVMAEAWRVRIARRIDDLNERTLQEKTRTLRHEMSHTIGATESSAMGWSAEDYASRCA
jgi:hypothetical protein